MTDKMNGILDIPDAALLSVTTIQELIEEYRRRLGTPPSGICLPVTSSGGLTYDSSLGITNVSPENRGRIYDLKRLMIEASNNNLPIYLMLVPTLPFATTSSDYNLVDSVGDETPKCCVVNPFTQEALQEIVKEVYKIALDNAIQVFGYVFTVQDLWPMGATGERLELTCLCTHCKEALCANSPGLNLDMFTQHPNPWNFALKDTGSGISHLGDIQAQDQPVQIIQKSKERNFYESQWFSSPNQENVWGQQLYLYAHSRNDITKNAIMNIMGAVPKGVRRVLMADRSEYDWTAGLFYSTLADMGCDELWFPPGRRPGSITNTETTTYMVARGRYIVDALFEFIHHASRVARLDPTASGTDLPDLRLRFVSHASKLLQALHFSRMEILPIQRAGHNFVVPVITEDIVRRIMEQLGLQTTSSVEQLAKLAALLKFGLTRD